MLIVCNGSSSRILRPKARTSCPRLPRQRLWHGVSVKLQQCSCSWRWPEATSRDKERAEGVHVLLLVLCPLNIRCIALVKELSVFWVSGWHLEKDGICNSCRVLFSILEWMDVLFGGVIFPLNRVCLWKPMLNQFFFPVIQNAWDMYIIQRLVIWHALLSSRKLESEFSQGGLQRYLKASSSGLL